MYGHQTYKQAKERPDFIVIALNPGWVKTGKSSLDYALRGSLTDFFFYRLGWPISNTRTARGGIGYPKNNRVSDSPTKLQASHIHGRGVSLVRASLPACTIEVSLRHLSMHYLIFHLRFQGNLVMRIRQILRAHRA